MHLFFAVAGAESMAHFPVKISVDMLIGFMGG